MENTWLPLIKVALSKPLPGGKSHARMLPPGRDLNIPGQSLNNLKSSSVLVLIYPDDNELYTCLLKRQPYLKYHGGQIGFPGGKMEEDDFSLIHTALRECEEEIGIRPSGVQLLGALSPLYISVSGFVIYPFVGWKSEKPEFIIDHNEVEKILPYPVVTNIHNRKIISAEVETHTGWLDVPAIEFEGEIIWGATAMILAEFFEILEQEMLEAGNLSLEV